MAAQPESDEPVTAALKRLMRQHGLTYRALATLTRDNDPGGRGVSYAYLCALTSGREHASRRSLELIAASLGINPDYFAEYRIAQLRDQLNTRDVGFQAAWDRYRQLVG